MRAPLQYVQLEELLLVEICALAVAGCLDCLGFWSLVLVLAFELIKFNHSLASSFVFKDVSILPKSQVSPSNCLVMINLSPSGIFLIRIGISKSPYVDKEIPRVSRALRFASSLSYSVRIPLMSCTEVTGCISIKFSMCVLIQSCLLLYLVSNISSAFL